MTISSHVVVSSSKLAIESSAWLLSTVVFEMDEGVSFLKASLEGAVHSTGLLKSLFLVSSSSLVRAFPFPGVPNVEVGTADVIFMVGGSFLLLVVKCCVDN